MTAARGSEQRMEKMQDQHITHKDLLLQELEHKQYFSFPYKNFKHTKFDFAFQFSCLFKLISFSILHFIYYLNFVIM